MTKLRDSVSLQLLACALPMLTEGDDLKTVFEQSTRSTAGHRTSSKRSFAVPFQESLMQARSGTLQRHTLRTCGWIRWTACDIYLTPSTSSPYFDKWTRDFVDRERNKTWRGGSVSREERGRRGLS